MPTPRTQTPWAAAALCLFACATAPTPRSEEAVAPQESASASEAPADAPSASETAAAPEAPPQEMPAAAPEGAFAGCAARLDEGGSGTRMIAGKKAQQTGARLRLLEPDADGQLVIGVLGPLNEASGLNLLALRRYLAFFAQEGVEAILVPGDVGETQDGITRALVELSAARVPVLVVSGNRECKEDFAQGVAEAQRKSDAIVNLNAIRSLELGGVTFVSLPGHYHADFITCESGCRYDAQTLGEVVTAAREATTPVVLVSHGPPRGTSSQSLDYSVHGGNAGDPQINRVLRDAKISFGVFSNIKEAGARATSIDLATLIPEEKPVKALLLNPGPADTSRWQMNDGSSGHGFAAVVTFSDGTGRWKLFRGSKPSKEDKKAAKALEPARSPPGGEKP